MNATVRYIDNGVTKLKVSITRESGIVFPTYQQVQCINTCLWEHIVVLLSQILPLHFTKDQSRRAFRYTDDVHVHAYPVCKLY